jgi:hypothetical protein
LSREAWPGDYCGHIAGQAIKKAAFRPLLDFWEVKRLAAGGGEILPLKITRDREQYLLPLGATKD